MSNSYLDFAGSEATRKVPIVNGKDTVSEIVQKIPEFSKECVSLDYFYVVGKEDKLRGVVSIKELFASKDDQKISDIMERKLVVSHPQVKRDRIANLALKHGIKSVPIVDDAGVFLGVFATSDLLQLLYEEHNAQAFKHAGILPLKERFETILDQPIHKSFMSRAPWIVVGLFGGLFAASIIGNFEATLSENIVLALFIPLIVYISDAVGTQTQTYFIRDIAFNPDISVTKYTLRQMVTTGLIGLTCAVIVLITVTLIWSSSYLGFVIGLATFIAVMSSTVLAIYVPYVLKRLNQDPASGSGPFATIIQDLLSIYIYFVIASWLI